MRYIADLHLHSKYSRATSNNLDIPTNVKWAKWKGIGLVGTGDFTHPIWFSEIKEWLEEDPEHAGLLRLVKPLSHSERSEESLAYAGQSRTGGSFGTEVGDPSHAAKAMRDRLSPAPRHDREPRFLLTVETSHIYSQGGRTRRVHIITLAPDLATVERIQRALSNENVKISSDGRPTMGVSVPKYMDMVLTLSEDCLVIPAHIWTPWHSLYGSRSGFDHFEDCFQEFSPFVYAIETGMSSDPAMNWRVKDLDGKSIVSFSDAHSPSKLGREVTIFEGEYSYWGVMEALRHPILRHPERSEGSLSDPPAELSSADAGGESQARTVANKLRDSSTPADVSAQDDRGTRIVATIEFYPEEGKYYHTGHRKCEVSQSPDETAEAGEQCPVCEKKLTVGVMHRVEQLSARQVELEQVNVTADEKGVRWIGTPKGLRPPYTMLVPLQEILSEVHDVGVDTKTVQGAYQRMVTQLGAEFDILLTADIGEVKSLFGAQTAEAIRRVREGQLRIDPGYDGKFGEVKIFGEEEKPSEVAKQPGFFHE